MEKKEKPARTRMLVSIYLVAQGDDVHKILVSWSASTARFVAQRTGGMLVSWSAFSRKVKS